MLQSCRAASKLVLLDCCPSGSVVQGWTSKGGPDPADRPAPSTLLHPTGVYFTTASDALQAASAKAPEGSLLGTSRFTGEIVEGLRSGRIKEGGWITPDDLFEYLAAHRVIKGVREEQRPTKSTVRATRSLPFARSVARPVRLPDAPRDTARADVSSALLKARRSVTQDAGEGVDPQRLLRYYAHCLGAQVAAGMLPDRGGGRGSAYFLLGQGPEAIQSGIGHSFPAPGQLPKPEEHGCTGRRDRAPGVLVRISRDHPSRTRGRPSAGAGADRTPPGPADGTRPGRERPRPAAPERGSLPAHRCGHRAALRRRGRRSAGPLNGYCYAGRLQVLTDVRRQVPPVDPSGPPIRLRCSAGWTYRTASPRPAAAADRGATRPRRTRCGRPSTNCWHACPRTPPSGW